MKKGKLSLVIVDYVTIIVAFITFLASMIIYKAFSYRPEAIFYIGMMVINILIVAIGFINLKEDTN